MRLILVFLAVAFLAATSAPAEPPRGAPVDAKYVPAPFVAALVFEPARLDKAAVAAGLPVGEAWKALEGLTGADTKQFERVVFLIDPIPGGNVAFMPAFVLRYPAGTDARKRLPALLGGDVKEAKAGDIAYVRSTKYKLAMVEMAGYAIDDRTLLVAAWPTLEPMLKPGADADKDRVLGAELAATDFGHDVVLVVTPAPVLKRIADREKQSGKPHDAPYYKELKPALERLTAITVAINLGKDPLLRAEFRDQVAALVADERVAVEALAALHPDPVRRHDRYDVRHGVADHRPAPQPRGVEVGVVGLGADRGRVEQDLRAHQHHRARDLGIPLVPADADAERRA